MKNIRSFNGVTPCIAEDVWLDPAAVVIGDVKIGQDSSVWPMVVIRGDVSHIRIGVRTNIQDGSILHISHQAPNANSDCPLIIGNDVTIGHQAMLHGCTIEDNSLIGMNAIVLDRAVVQSNVLVGAGSLVSP
ncbi:MAG: gamma carbonic anhydrase family protein, partial [Gammaproteobacteria bacterium]|nr:gamma carbonic anhydrase family protein [Gammaproteobacteria bacterium]